MFPWHTTCTNHLMAIRHSHILRPLRWWWTLLIPICIFNVTVFLGILSRTHSVKRLGLTGWLLCGYMMAKCHSGDAETLTQFNSFPVTAKGERRRESGSWRVLLLPFSCLVVAATGDRDCLIGDMKSLDWTAEICLLPAAAGVLTDSSPWAFEGQ